MPSPESQKIMLIIICSMGLWMPSLEASTIHTMQLGSGYEFALPPNDPQIFKNPFLWDISAECVITSDIDAYPLLVRVLRKKGTLNGKHLSTGDTVQLILHAKDKIRLTAVSGAEVELTNLSNEMVKADCAMS